MFRIGQKVVCVDDSPHWYTEVAPRLVKDEVYTIASTEKCGDGFGVDLIEVPISDRERRAGHKFYNSTRFRPAVETKTDISIFTKMLRPQDQKEDA